MGYVAVILNGTFQIKPQRSPGLAQTTSVKFVNSKVLTSYKKLLEPWHILKSGLTCAQGAHYRASFLTSNSIVENLCRTIVNVQEKVANNN